MKKNSGHNLRGRKARGRMARAGSSSRSQRVYPQQASFLSELLQICGDWRSLCCGAHWLSFLLRHYLVKSSVTLFRQSFHSKIVLNRLSLVIASFASNLRGAGPVIPSFALL